MKKKKKKTYDDYEEIIEGREFNCFSQCTIFVIEFAKKTKINLDLPLI